MHVGAVQHLAAQGNVLAAIGSWMGLPVNRLMTGETCQSLVSALATPLPNPGLVATSVVLKTCRWS